MEKRSRHYGDVTRWIEKVIDSCETFEQTRTARKLLENFSYQLVKKTPDKYWRSYQYDIIGPLELVLDNKRKSLMN